MRKATRVRALLFDLDGTLLDSAPDLVGALNRVRRSEGLQPLALESVREYASRGAAGLLAAGMPPTDAEQFESWKQAFLECYERYSFVESRLFEGVEEVLTHLELRHLPWGIVTNKSERLTQPVLRAAGLAQRTSCVVCGDTLARSKPDPAPVLHACKLLGTEPGHTLFVGDDTRDILAGRAAGTRLAAVFYGYGSAELTDELVGDSIRLCQPRELIAYID